MDFLTWGVHRAQLTRTVTDGLAAAVELYYDNYADAEELESDFVNHLLAIAQDAQLTEDSVYGLIVDVENQLNEDGGVMGSDGVRHQVRTASAHDSL